MSAATALSAANALIAAGQVAQALVLLRAEQPRYPRHAGLALRLADVLQASGQLNEAIAAYGIALGRDRNLADGWYGAGCAHLALGAAGEAVRCFSRAAALAPASGPVRYNLAKALFMLGRIESAVTAFEQAEQLGPEVAQMARESLACITPGDPRSDHVAVLRTRRRWAEVEARGISTLPLRPVPAAGRKLRIGYVSAFFGDPNWMKPVFALINRHDRSAFEITMWSDGKLPGTAGGYRDHDLDVIADLRAVSNDRAARIIADAGMDVLVDLNGYSFQSRLSLLMYRPAPHIVGWFNMFAATGVGAFDWLVGDATVIRPEEEPFYTERIHRLPGSYLAFEVLYDVPEVAPPPCIDADGAVTFGCLGSHYKLADCVLSAWARILHGAPRAKLFIKNGGLQDGSIRADLLARLTALGVAAERVTLQGRSPHFEFLDAYRHVDIALDTFPYNGGTTTTEALWQGVPVLAFDGDRWASRTSKSLLLAGGLLDWVMPDEAAYVDQAIRLANDTATPARLNALRSGMRPRLRASGACDADSLCREMERFYRALVAADEKADRGQQS